MATANYKVTVIKPGRPKIVPTFQYLGKASDCDETIYQKAIETIVAWLNKKYPIEIPLPNDSPCTFEDTHYGQSISCTKLNEPISWTCRLIQPDAPFRDRLAVPGRNWITEISLSLLNTELNIYTKILCSSLSYGNASIAHARPRFLLDLSEFINFADIFNLSSTPFSVDSEESYLTFIDLLFNPGRTLPVIVTTQPEQEKFSIPVTDFLVDTENLANKLKFSAHIIELAREYSFKLTDDIGKEWSVFGGAVRIYWPNISKETSRCYDHDLFLPNRIIFWKTEDSFSEKAFENFTHDLILSQNATKNIEHPGILQHHDAKLLYNETAQKSIIDHDKSISNYQETVVNLKYKIEILKQENQEAWGLATIFQIERDEFKAELEKSNHLIKNLKYHLEQSSGGAFEDTVFPLDSYDKMPEWVMDNLSDRLELHPRAVRSLKNASYLDVKTVYELLKILAFQYYNMQTGALGAKEQFNSALTKLSTEYRQSISTHRSGEEGDEYFVEYPPGSKQKTFIKWHLRKGTSHDDKYCLGIYFFWDERKSKTIVCWLPSHLNNRST